MHTADPELEHNSIKAHFDLDIITNEHSNYRYDDTPGQRETVFDPPMS
jgi:hypothetical protein